MKTILSILASALLLTYLSVQLFTLFGQSSAIILYVTIFFSLLINGLFIHYQSNLATQTTKSQHRQRPQRKGNSSRTKGNNKGPRSRSNAKPQEKTNQISTKDDSNRLEGEIKWYNRRKNYGFIVEDSGDEIFFHQQEVLLLGFGRANTTRRPRGSRGRGGTLLPDGNPAVVDLVLSRGNGKRRGARMGVAHPVLSPRDLGFWRGWPLVLAGRSRQRVWCSTVGGIN